MHSLWRTMSSAWLGGFAFPALIHAAEDTPMWSVQYRDRTNRLSTHQDETIAKSQPSGSRASNDTGPEPFALYH